MLTALLLLATVQAQNPALLERGVCQPSKEMTCGASMQAVNAALRSPTTLWKFITAPDTGYFERVTAAYRAGKLVPASWIPKILSAQKELAKEEAVHHFGVQLYPYDARGHYWEKTPRDRLGGAINRNILGHSFTVPEKWTEYPLTDEAIKRVPWPFQVETALSYLFKAVLRDGDSKQNDVVALAMPCREDESASVLVSLTVAIANSHVKTTQDKPYLPLAVLGAWFNILKNPRIKNASEFVPIGAADWRCTLRIGPCPWAEVLALESLKNHDRSVIGRIPHLYGYPHVLILASARFVLSPEYRQYHTARDQAEDSDVLLSIISPYSRREPLPNSRSDNDPAYDRLVSDFAKVFKGYELSLQREADIERPLIENGRRTLSAFTKCRP